MNIANQISALNRRRKYFFFLKTFPITPETTILDIGFADEEHSPNDNYLEKNYPYPNRITALGLMEPRLFVHRYPAVKTVVYDGRVFPFEDKSFDICWSNAVIEHVGDVDAQINFLKEIKRVSKSAYITTPNRRFPVELHTRVPLMHFLPKPLFDRFLKVINKPWATGDYMRLLSKGDIHNLLKMAGIDNYRIKSNRWLGLAMDFSISLWF